MAHFDMSRRAALAGAAAAVTAGSLPAFAQAKPIQFILPNAVSSGVDTITRTIQNELSKHLGAPIVVNNQPGAGGVIGTQQMVRSAPDGTTLSIVSNNHVIYPSVLKSIPFDPITDITPIAVLGSTPLVMVVNPAKVPAKTAQELNALFKANPDKHTYASGGNGTILHLAAAIYTEQASVKMTHVPYKGVGPMVTDLIGGQVDMGILAYPSAQAHIKSGALRAIGFCTPKRVPAAAEIPTFVEQGMADFVVETWFSCIGPAKMPAAEVARINDALVKTFDAPEIKEAMAKQANIIDIKSPDVAAAFLKSELAKYAAVVKKIGLEPQ
jgi:tripartite-type tricarboxylate transporter receptor subunit TctC